MHAVVSLLSPIFYGRVERIRETLKGHCALTGIRMTPYPHFSWQIAEEYDWNAMANSLPKIAREIAPFAIQTSGLGIFSGKSPVIYIPVIRTELLNTIHKRIWDELDKIAERPSPYYAPRDWMPHISLAYTDVSQENIGCAVDLLMPQNFNWQIEIKNICVIFEPNNSIGHLRDKYDLSG